MKKPKILFSITQHWFVFEHYDAFGDYRETISHSDIDEARAYLNYYKKLGYEIIFKTA